MSNEHHNGNNWRAGLSRDLGRLEGEIAAVHRLLEHPEHGIGALHRKLSENKAEIARMRLTQFATGGILVLFGVLTGQIAPELGKQLLRVTALFERALVG